MKTIKEYVESVETVDYADFQNMKLYYFPNQKTFALYNENVFVKVEEYLLIELEVNFFLIFYQENNPLSFCNEINENKELLEFLTNKVINKYL